MKLARNHEVALEEVARNMQEMIEKTENASRTAIWASGWKAGAETILALIGYSSQEIQGFFINRGENKE